MDKLEPPLASHQKRYSERVVQDGGRRLCRACAGCLRRCAVRASTQMMKLSDVSEFTTSCNFCSCGCGMVATVREGKLITMEGDFDHIVKRGSLCVKGISMFAMRLRS